MSNPQSFCWWYPDNEQCQDGGSDAAAYADDQIMEAKLSYTWVAIF